MARAMEAAGVAAGMAAGMAAGAIGAGATAGVALQVLQGRSSHVLIHVASFAHHTRLLAMVMKRTKGCYMFSLWTSKSRVARV